MTILTKERHRFVLPEHRYEYDFWTVRSCKLTKQCIEQLAVLLASLTNSYRLLVGSADEFNRISLAKRSDVEDAIHRASDLGEIIDDIIKKLDQKLDDYLDVVCKCDSDIQLLRPGIPQPPSVVSEPPEELQFEETELPTGASLSDSASQEPDGAGRL